MCTLNLSLFLGFSKRYAERIDPARQIHAGLGDEIHRPQFERQQRLAPVQPRHREVQQHQDDLARMPLEEVQSL